jgi:hypothetical protein
VASSDVFSDTVTATALPKPFGTPSRSSELGALLKEAVFQLNTRRFGALTELFIKRLKSFDRSQSIFYDLHDAVNGQRVEVKFSTVQSKWSTPLREDNLEAVLREAVSRNRAVVYPNWPNSSFDCNIQQVKPAEFETLFYGLFFDDRILLFKCTTDDIARMPGWSAKQHKGNVGEGQFHITSRNLQHHIDNYLVQYLSYTQFANILFDH